MRDVKLPSPFSAQYTEKKTYAAGDRYSCNKLTKLPALLLISFFANTAQDEMEEFLKPYAYINLFPKETDLKRFFQAFQGWTG